MMITALHSEDVFSSLRQQLSAERCLYNIPLAARSFIISSIFNHPDYQGKLLWVIDSTEKNLKRYHAELSTLGVNSTVFLSDLYEQGGDAYPPELLVHLEKGSEPLVLLTTPESLKWQLPNLNDLDDKVTTYQVSQIIEPDDIVTHAVGQGFERVDQIYAPQQVAARGGIVDIFPLNESAPIRLDFFDNELESIRRFDLNTQNSTGEFSSARILFDHINLEMSLAEALADKGALLTFESCTQESAVILTDAESDKLAHLKVFEDVPQNCPEPDLSFGTTPLGVVNPGDFVQSEARQYQIKDQIAQWIASEWKITAIASDENDQKRFLEILNLSKKQSSQLSFVEGDFWEGFVIPEAKVAVLSVDEVFGRFKSTHANRMSKSLDDQRKLTVQSQIEDLEPDELIVHLEYGIGRYLGISKEDPDLILIEYADKAILSVSVNKAHLLAKYIGMGGGTPKLSKLGDASWSRARKKTEKSIYDYAAQLLHLQAEREAVPCDPHPPDSPWMFEFEQAFPYRETPDQLESIEDVKADMECQKPMDRLICGDVGFGKTEVAIRAAFKAATGGRQVVVLVPTTVLAEQHWRNFRARMSNYPLRIDLLNRFRKPSEIRETEKGLMDGSVDIVIGTHRILSDKISYKNLGLVVVDEEQRFGVKHKEKLKDRFRQVDMMTLSATPIPRTLYLSLMGARDLSTIDTPPPNRIPVKTKIASYEERLIEEYATREIARGGQVFFLHNRVQTIEAMRDTLAKLMPSARILIGHGQMPKDELESVMRTFVDHEADILLATTIIETGVDIPNANTIIIDRADRFGLADLYQLRGRVGRSDQQAHALLLLPQDQVTAGDARKRINAIKQYTELGSGFKIAMRDLEIRGAGSLLGTKQSGHIAAVGFDLYCQLLKQSIDALRGKRTIRRRDIQVKFNRLCLDEKDYDETSEVEPAFISKHYMPTPELRISAYRSLAEANTLEALDELTEQWRDRFGVFPRPINHLILITKIKILASENHIESVEIRGQRLMLQRNGASIVGSDKKFPRLKAYKVKEMLEEVIKLLANY